MKDKQNNDKFTIVMRIFLEMSQNLKEPPAWMIFETTPFQIVQPFFSIQGTSAAKCQDKNYESYEIRIELWYNYGEGLSEEEDEHWGKSVR